MGEKNMQTIIIDQLNRYDGGCMDMDDPEKEHPVTKQQTKEALVKVKAMTMKWKEDIRAREGGSSVELMNQQPSTRRN